MATLIFPDGKIKTVKPENGTDFQLNGSLAPRRLHRRKGVGMQTRSVPLRQLDNEHLLAEEKATMQNIDQLLLRIGDLEARRSPNVFKQCMMDLRVAKAKLARIKTEMAFREIIPPKGGKKTKGQLNAHFKGGQRGH